MAKLKKIRKCESKLSNVSALMAWATLAVATAWSPTDAVHTTQPTSEGVHACHVLTSRLIPSLTVSRSSRAFAR